MNQEKIDALRTGIVVTSGHFVDGKSIPASDGRVLDVFSPIDGAVFTQIAAGTPEDMTNAISVARNAFEDGRWSRLDPASRKKVMLKFAELIEKHALELAVLGVRDNGTEIGMALKAEPLSAAGSVRFYAEALDKTYGQIAPTSDNILGLVHHVPVGVVGAIIPWNMPMMIGAWKFAPALAAGNSVVLKPPESAALTLLKLAELACEAGMPDGVFNVVTGKGSVVGEVLALSMDVDVLVFTGSGTTGRRLLEYSARSNLKRCYHELGGKSPNVFFADAPDLGHAAKVSADGIFRNSGQICVAGSRLQVEKEIVDDFVNAMVANANAYRVSDPLDLSNQIGAVHSISELESNLDFVKIAQSEGAVLRCGGNRILEDNGGYYMQPTILSRVGQRDTLFQKEVFGPVLAVTSFNSEDEVIRLANSTELGLAAGVWTSNLSRAHQMVANND